MRSYLYLTTNTGGADGGRCVTLEDPIGAASALDWMRRGMDFANALHVAKAVGREAFVSFDQRLVAIANALGDVRVRAP